MIEISLYAKYNDIFCSKKIEPNLKHKLMNIYRLYTSSNKLANEKNYNKMHKIADKYLSNAT